jgi:hypothetical protein
MRPSPLWSSIATHLPERQLRRGQAAAVAEGTNRRRTKLTTSPTHRSGSSLSPLWLGFLDRGEQEGTFPLVSPQGSRRDVAYTATTHILPTQHLLILHDQNRKKIDNASVSSWVRDYAFFLLDTEPDLRLLLGRGAPLWPTKDTR